jgi:hypothetical protein
MSKLSQAIQAVQTKDRHYKMPLLIDVTDDTYTFYSEPASNNFVNEYRVEAKFGTRIMTDQSTSSTILDMKINDCRRNIIEAVFGEFRIEFVEVYHALAHRDIDGAMLALENFHHKMFKVEEK